MLNFFLSIYIICCTFLGSNLKCMLSYYVWSQEPVQDARWETAWWCVREYCKPVQQGFSSLRYSTMMTSTFDYFNKLWLINQWLSFMMARRGQLLQYLSSGHVSDPCERHLCIYDTSIEHYSTWKFHFTSPPFATS